MWSLFTTCRPTVGLQSTAVIGYYYIGYFVEIIANCWSLNLRRPTSWRIRVLITQYIIEVQKSSNCIKSKASFMPIFSYTFSASGGQSPDPYQGSVPGPRSGPAGGLPLANTLSEPPLLDTELRPCRRILTSEHVVTWAVIMTLKINN